MKITIMIKNDNNNSKNDNKKHFGKASADKNRKLSGIAQISEKKKNPTPNLGNLVLFFPDVKTTFYAYDRKKVPMMHCAQLGPL